ncbi:efflux RND transporter permease subunit [Patescibacteria group bacterium]|nr:efflux RND transporter permease subunit [Patescibacteria group bacterium]
MQNKLEKLDKIFRKEEKGLFGFFIFHYRFTYLIMMAVIVLGMFSIYSMPREAEPEIKVPYAMVVAVYPGANPIDVEELVTDELESKIKGLDNLNKYNSNSSLGVSSIFIEFEAEADIDESMQKLREAIDLAKQNLPGEVEDPSVSQISITDFPIVTYSLVGNYDDLDLKKYSDILRDEFLDVDSVSKVNIIGAVIKEYQVIVDQTKLANFGLSLSQIVGAIKSSNLNIPAGNIEVDSLKYNVSLRAKIKNLEDLRSIIVTTYGKSPVYLTDIAEVIDTVKSQDTLSRIGIRDSEAKNTISLQLYKKTGGNILNIVDNTQTLIDKLKKDQIIPRDLAVIKTNDNAVHIKKNLSTLGTSGIQTMIFIVLILFVVIGFRASLITSLSVPIAFLTAFIFLYANGMTLNGMVLFSLVLSLGLMVDNSIVIIEGINEYIKKYNKSRYQASVLSVWDYKWPIIAGTMTTVSAFLPMLLVSGIMGEYLSIMPITLSATLLSSLFVALVIIPTLSHRFVTECAKSDSEHSITEKYIESFKIIFEKFLRNLLSSKLKRGLYLSLAWALFIVAIYMPLSGRMQIQMFPKVDIDYFVINVELRAGSILEDTRKIIDQIESEIIKIPEMDNYVTNLGTSASVGLTGDDYSQDATHLATITVNLVDAKKRDRKSYVVSEAFRKQIDYIKGAKINIEELSAGPPQGVPIEVRIIGDEQESLARVAMQTEAILNNIEGVINVKDSLRDSPGEFVYTFDKVKLNYYGLDVAHVSSEVRSALYGVKAGELQIDGEGIDIKIKYANDHFSSLDQIGKLVVGNINGEHITFDQVAKLELKPALLSLSHKDGDGLISVSASLKDGVDLVGVIKEFNDKLNEYNLPQGIRIETGGEVEDIDKSFRETFMSMIVAVILIAIILVLMFNSFIQPLIILFSLPLAIIGVVFGLLVMQMPFSFTSFIGVVALSGIVVNDAIVLIDRINKNIKAGLNVLDATVDAGVSRMQPIFLTSITTVAGIIPLVWADEMWKGFSISVIFGLIFSTMLTLVIIPIMYIGFSKSK